MQAFKRPTYYICWTLSYIRARLEDIFGFLPHTLDIQTYIGSLLLPYIILTQKRTQRRVDWARVIGDCWTTIIIKVEDKYIIVV